MGLEMSKNKDNKFLEEKQKFIEERIKEINLRIASIDSQLLSFERILDELKQKINYYEKQEKYTEKSRLMRWYIEDIKVYNELNQIRAHYEKLLLDYNSQSINSNLKFKELELKKKKLDMDMVDTENLIKKIYEELEKLKQKDDKTVDIKVTENDSDEFDDIYKL